MVSLGVGDTFIEQPSVHLVIGLEPQPRCEEAFTDEPDLVLDLTLLPARCRCAGDRIDEVMTAHLRELRRDATLPDKKKQTAARMARIKKNDLGTAPKALLKKADEQVAAAYNPSDYPRRQPIKLRDDKFIALLMDRLEELKQQTHPKDGLKSAKGKDNAALTALQLAGVLVGAVAGWAIDHAAGLALEDLTFVSGVPRGQQNRHAYREALARVDDHRHERHGGMQQPWQQVGWDKKVQRKWLINLLTANAGGFPSSPSRELLFDLQARHYAEINPGRRNSLLVLEMRLQTLCCIEYLLGFDARCTSKEAVGNYSPLCGGLTRV
jgi:hypothetical protein